jgi:hypothetical protein
MNYRHFMGISVNLGAGKILSAGGESNGSTNKEAEIYEIATDTWTPVANMNRARMHFSAVKLANGKVLVAGGNYTSDASAELFDPITETWTEVASMHYPRMSFTMTLLQDGRVLVTGGGSPTSEIYDPITDSWTIIAQM